MRLSAPVHNRTGAFSFNLNGNMQHASNNLQERRVKPMGKVAREVRMSCAGCVGYLILFGIAIAMVILFSIN